LDYREEKKAGPICSLRTLVISIGAIAVVIAIGLVSFYFSIIEYQSIQGGDAWASMGDFFGGVLNPLFALFAFIALLFTIVIQGEELHLTTGELRKSAESLQQQIMLLEMQTFGNTFFQLLRQHNEIVNDITIRVSSDTPDGIVKRTHDGRDCFVFFVKELYSTINQKILDHPDDSQIEIIEKSYAEFSESYQSEFGHYFLNLYSIIRFVDDSSIDRISNEMSDNDICSFEKRKTYTNLIRAQLSSYELILLYYNCVWSGGGGRFKALVDRYEMLDNLELQRIRFPTVDSDKLKLFGRNAFGPQLTAVGGRPTVAGYQLVQEDQQA